MKLIKLKMNSEKKKCVFDENIAFGIMIETPSSVVLFDV